MKKLFFVFVDKLGLFTEKEFEELNKKAEIKFVGNEFKQQLFFQINFLEEPLLSELIKLFEFNNEAVTLSIKLDFLYDQTKIYQLIKSFYEFKKKTEIKKHLFPEINLLFNFPEFTLNVENQEQYYLCCDIFEVVKEFLTFVFGNQRIYIDIQKTYLNESRYKKGKFFVFFKEDFNVFATKQKTFSVGITNYKEHYLLLFSGNENDEEESMNNLMKDVWYEISFVLDHGNTLKKLDGRMNFYKRIDTPVEHLKVDIAVRKIQCLSLHTKFSTFDGLFNYSDFAKLAVNYSHKALGVTDFASAQSFSKVEESAKKFNLKPLYGCELELFEKNIDAIANAKNFDINQEIVYCIFDIETTGFYPLFDEIIEIAIIKYKNGMELESYYSLVKCEQKLKPEIVEITGITDERLKKGGKNIQEVLKNVVAFVEGSVLVAHNGIAFDLPFLNAFLLKYGMKKLNNPLIDTFHLSKSLYFEGNHKSHTLEAIAKRSGMVFDDGNFHNAHYDTKMLANIWHMFEVKLLEKGLECKKGLVQINEAMNQFAMKNNFFGQNILIYAKNQEGIRDLYELISIAHTTQFFSKPTINYESINKLRKNLILVTSAINSPCVLAILKNDKEKFKELCESYDYLLIPPVDHFVHDINRGLLSEKNIEKIISVFCEWSLEFGRKGIFSFCAKTLSKENMEQYKVLIHAKNIGGKRHYLYSYKGKNDVYPHYAFKNTDEVLESFNFLKLKGEDMELLSYKNQEELIELIDEGIEIVKRKLHAPKMDGIEEKMKKLIFERAYEKYGKTPDEFIFKMIDKELNQIIKNEFTVVYWVSHLLVKQSIEDGYLVGSRGSVGSSFVAHLLNISEVNPLIPHYYCSDCSYFELINNFFESGFDLEDKDCPNCKKLLMHDGQNIPFETFLGLDGNKIPDIDLNFSGENQIKAHNFLRELFGKDNTFRSGTISTVADKTAFALALNYLEDNGLKYTNGKIMWLKNQIINVKRTSGQHPGGILIVPDTSSVFDFTPLNYPANDLSSDWLTTHLDFNDLHDSLFKFDILGHDDPTFLSLLHKSTGFDPRKIEYTDKNILKLFSSITPLKIKSADILGERVGSIGLPEFGTKLTRKILNACKVKTFADLIRISGISHGTHVWKNNIDNLVKNEGFSLSRVITCRDDVMIYLIFCGIDAKTAFEITESVRKGRGVPKDKIPMLLEKNVPKWYIESANKISYIFPKAHAAAYVLMSWKIAYYKLYYPLDFYSAYFTIHNEHFNVELLSKNDPELIKADYTLIKESLKKAQIKASSNSKSKHLMIIYEVALEMLARGITFKAVDVNTSDTNLFLINREENSILMPFCSMVGLGNVVSEEILIDRKANGIYKDREDIEKRTKLNVTILKRLEALGAIPARKKVKQLSINDFF